MTLLGEAIRKHRVERAMTLAQLAEHAGCSKAYLSGIETGRVANPPSEPILRAIARALGLAPETLTRLADWQRTPAPIRADLNRLATQQQQLQQLLAGLSSQSSDSPRNLDELYRSGQLQRIVEQTQSNLCPTETLGRLVPLINKVAAGYPTDFTDLDYPARVADEYIPCPHLDDPDAFAARVVGMSMKPDYNEGDMIIFSPRREPTHGCDCFVRLLPDHHSTFKRVYFENEQHVRLQPLNPAFAPQVIELDQVAGLYPAVMRIQSIQPPPASSSAPARTAQEQITHE
jgi:SOS-response transcriptional repressor LexA